MKNIIFLISLLICIAKDINAQTMQVQTNWWQPAGVVNTMVKHPSKNVVFIGGDFTTIGPTGGNSIMLDSSTGMYRYDFPSANDSVMAMVSDGHGGFFIAGDFTQVGDSLRNRIAHIDSTGLVTSLFSDGGFNGLVSTILLVNNKLYVAGFFSEYKNTSISRLIAIDATNGELLPWNFTIYGAVNSLAFANNTLYAVGSISGVNGSGRSGAAAFDLTTGNLLSWNPTISGTILSSATDSNNIFLGTYGSVYAVSLTQSAIKWKQNSGYNLNSTNVLALAVLGNYVYYGGSFYDMQSKRRYSRLGRLNISDGKEVSMIAGQASIDGEQVRSLIAHKSRLYVGGKIASYVSSDWGGVGVYDTLTGGLSWGPIFNGIIFCMAPTSNGVFVGGSFSSVGGMNRSRVAAMELSWGKPTDWSANVNGTVYSMAVADTVVYIGGNFTTVNGVARKNFAAVHIETGTLLPLIANTDYAVRGFLVDGSLLYMCGDFATVNNQLRKGVAQINRHTGDILSWAPNANASVYTLAKYNNTIYAGGNYTEIGGATRNHLAAIDVNGVANGWNPNVNGTNSKFGNGSVNKLLVMDNLIFVGGDFINVGNLPQGRPVQFNLITGNLTSWRCSVGNINNDMFVINDNLIIGSKTSIDVSLVNKNTGEVKNIIPPIAGTSVNAVMALGNLMLVGGDFTAVDGKPVTGLAVLKSDRNVATPQIPNRLSGVSIYPNPSTGQVTIANTNHTNLQVTVYDLSGKLVYAPSTCLPQSNTLLSLPLSPGIYVISIQSEQGHATHKLVITN